MKAKFVGRTSCGFITNKIYNIDFKPMRCRSSSNLGFFGRKSSFKSYKVLVYDTEFPRRCCPYSSLDSFCENWVLLYES